MKVLGLHNPDDSSLVSPGCSVSIQGTQMAPFSPEGRGDTGTSTQPWRDILPGTLFAEEGQCRPRSKPHRNLQ